MIYYKSTRSPLKKIMFVNLKKDKHNSISSFLSFWFKLVNFIKTEQKQSMGLTTNVASYKTILKFRWKFMNNILNWFFKIPLLIQIIVMLSMSIIRDGTTIQFRYNIYSCWPSWRLFTQLVNQLYSQNIHVWSCIGITIAEYELGNQMHTYYSSNYSHTTFLWNTLSFKLFIRKTIMTILRI